jgi:hypothetical protein
VVIPFCKRRNACCCRRLAVAEGLLLQKACCCRRLVVAEGLLLQKEGYTLALAYLTSHASGAEGCRFIEAFTIPGLTPDAAWGSCSGAATYIAEPARRTLLFQNILINTGLPDVRAKCGIPRDLGQWVGNGLGKRFLGEQRWYAGYFTSSRGYFFNESGEPCESKLYSLLHQRQKLRPSSLQSAIPNWSKSFSRPSISRPPFNTNVAL